MLLGRSRDSPRSLLGTVLSCGCPRGTALVGERKGTLLRMSGKVMLSRCGCRQHLFLPVWDVGGRLVTRKPCCCLQLTTKKERYTRQTAGQETREKLASD